MDDDGNVVQDDEVPLEKKRQILEVRKQNPGWSFRCLRSRNPSLKFRQYLYKWEQQILEGGTRRDKLKTIDSYTFDRFSDARKDGKPVHDDDIRFWALHRSRKIPNLVFEASRKWLYNFKQRHGIVSRKVQKLLTRKELYGSEENKKREEEFRQQVKEKTAIYHPSMVWNGDQVGFSYELLNIRTLSHKGERRTTLTAVSPKNKATHSYTAQYMISLEGKIVGKPFICLQEPAGKFGPRVHEKLFAAPNLSITCSKSGKLTKTHVKYYVKEVLAIAAAEAQNILTTNAIVSTDQTVPAASVTVCFD